MHPQPTTIHFVRHGAVHNPQELFYGRLPHFGLSAKGLQQVDALLPFFAGRRIDAVCSSPLLRARQTASHIARACGIGRVSTSALLTEVRTPYDGWPLSRLGERHWDLYSGNPPPNEQPADVLLRVRRFVDKVLRHHAGEQVVAVSHGDPIVFLSLWANGYEASLHSKNLVEQGSLLPVRFPANASAATFTWPPGSDRPQFSYHNPGDRA